MIVLSETELKKIADGLASNFRVFIDPQTGELGEVLDFSDADFDLEDYLDGIGDEDEAKAERERIEKMEDEWIELGGPDSRDSFGVMEAFIEVVTEMSLKDKLWKALQQKRPFANFKNVIDNAGAWRNKWFEFQQAKQVEHLKRQLRGLNIAFEEGAEQAPNTAAILTADDLDQNMLLTIRLKARDAELLQEINALFHEVFQYDTPPSASLPYLERLLFSERHLVFALTYQHELVGALTAHLLPDLYSENTEVFIYDIAVKPQWQRLGFGARLLKAVQNNALKNGYAHIWVAADVEDEHALDFYRKHGGEASEVQHFEFKPSPKHVKGR
jgi:aminoglycoside 3-N-acetyltransferase I